MELLGKISAKYRDADPQPQLHADKTSEHKHNIKSRKEHKKDYIPEIENAHPIPQLSTLDVEPKHGHLGLGQSLAALGIQAARVLHAGPEASAQHAGADLVVLLVGGGRLDGDGPRTQQRDVLHLASVRGLERGRRNLGDALLQLLADADADHGRGQIAPVQQRVEVIAIEHVI